MAKLILAIIQLFIKKQTQQNTDNRYGRHKFGKRWT